jgi:hypothetical protein
VNKLVQFRLDHPTGFEWRCVEVNESDAQRVMAEKMAGGMVARIVPVGTQLPLVLNAVGAEWRPR